MLGVLHNPMFPQLVIIERGYDQKVYGVVPFIVFMFFRRI